MTRGKHSGQTMARRAYEAEERVKVLERALRKEEREHAVTRRVAERATALELRCRELDQQVQLCTSDEVAQLTEKVAELRQLLQDEKYLHARTTKGFNHLLDLAKQRDAQVGPNGSHLTTMEEFMHEFAAAVGSDDDLRAPEDEQTARTTIVAGVANGKKLGGDGVRRIQRARGYRK